MKCPKCETDHKYRYGMTCTCGYSFVFDPKRTGMTDGRFLALVRGASGNDTYYFTENQLYAQWCKKTMPSPKWPALIAAFFLAVTIGLLVAIGFKEAFPFPIFAGFLTLMLLGLAAQRQFSAPPKRELLHGLVSRWQEADRDESLEKLLVEPSLHEPPPEWNEPDIYDYGVERILVVERDILVDLFVRNGLHARQRSLVIAESRYPQYLAPHVERLTAENPQLPVFLLHDATLAGEGMEARIRRTSELPLTGHQSILDLGITPTDVARLDRLWPLRPGRQENRLPVDMLPLAVLEAGIETAMAEGTTLGELLARQEQTGGTDVDTTSFG